MGAPARREAAKVRPPLRLMQTLAPGCRYARALRAVAPMSIRASVKNTIVEAEKA